MPRVHSPEVLWTALDRAVCKRLRDAKSRVAVFFPFVSLAAVRALAPFISVGVEVRILVRWRLADFLSGVADLALFDECRTRGWTLRAHPRIHLKSLMCDERVLLTGSANLTERGLGTSPEPNIETVVDGLVLTDDYLSFLESVWDAAKPVDDEFVDYLRKAVTTLRARFPELDDSIEAAEWDLDRELAKGEAFLISQLPMSSQWQDIYAVGRGDVAGLDTETVDCARHDLGTYLLRVRPGESATAFRTRLATAFLNHPFVASLASFIDRPRRFGAVKEWIQRTCKDVPIPSRRDLTGNVQVLFRWLVEFSEGGYVVSRPGYAEVIHPFDRPVPAGEAFQPHGHSTGPHEERRRRRGRGRERYRVRRGLGRGRQ